MSADFAVVVAINVVALSVIVGYAALFVTTIVASSVVCIAGIAALGRRAIFLRSLPLQ